MKKLQIPLIALCLFIVNNVFSQSSKETLFNTIVSLIEQQNLGDNTDPVVWSGNFNDLVIVYGDRPVQTLAEGLNYFEHAYTINLNHFTSTYNPDSDCHFLEPSEEKIRWTVFLPMTTDFLSESREYDTYSEALYMKTETREHCALFEFLNFNGATQFYNAVKEMEAIISKEKN